MRSTLRVLLLLLASASLTFAAAAAAGLWMEKVPEKDSQRQNPFAENPSALPAGAKLFRQNCASCHGEDATGRGNHPSLRTDRIRAATPGQLEWLLKNGSMKAGMPSWSRLPEQQRWQIVTYLKSLSSSPEGQFAASSK